LFLGRAFTLAGLRSPRPRPAPATVPTERAESEFEAAGRR
jgi:hypothetical protein